MQGSGIISERIGRLDWAGIDRQLDGQGFATTPKVLTPAECEGLVTTYETDSFRKRVDMGPHGYGEGEYKYFANPLPAIVSELRSALFPHLSKVAGRWAVALKSDETYPATLDEYLALCHGKGQLKPTPLLLRYDQGGYNCLHQDLYGDLAFPLQVVFVLSRPGHDFRGGNLLLVEQRPRAQSRGEAIELDQGAALIFPTRLRPVAGKRGFHRVNVRHGISTLRSGRRYSLGLIFHDAK
jgi:uncharacterized protein